MAATFVQNRRIRERKSKYGHIPLSSGEVEYYSRCDDSARRRQRLLEVRQLEKQLAQEVTQRYRSNLQKLQNKKLQASQRQQQLQQEVLLSELHRKYQLSLQKIGTAQRNARLKVSELIEQAQAEELKWQYNAASVEKERFDEASHEKAEEMQERMARRREIEEHLKQLKKLSTHQRAQASRRAKREQEQQIEAAKHREKMLHWRRQNAVEEVVSMHQPNSKDVMAYHYTRHHCLSTPAPAITARSEVKIVHHNTSHPSASNGRKEALKYRDEMDRRKEFERQKQEQHAQKADDRGEIALNTVISKKEGEQAMQWLAHVDKLTRQEEAKHYPQLYRDPYEETDPEAAANAAEEVFARMLGIDEDSLELSRFSITTDEDTLVDHAGSDQVSQVKMPAPVTTSTFDRVAVQSPKHWRSPQSADLFQPDAVTENHVGQPERVVLDGKFDHLVNSTKGEEIDDKYSVLSNKDPDAVEDLSIDDQHFEADAQDLFTTSKNGSPSPSQSAGITSQRNKLKHVRDSTTHPVGPNKSVSDAPPFLIQKRTSDRQMESDRFLGNPDNVRLGSSSGSSMGSVTNSERQQRDMDSIERLEDRLQEALNFRLQQTKTHQDRHLSEGLLDGRGRSPVQFGINATTVNEGINVDLDAKTSGTNGETMQDDNINATPSVKNDDYHLHPPIHGFDLPHTPLTERRDDDKSGEMDNGSSSKDFMDTSSEPSQYSHIIQSSCSIGDEQRDTKHEATLGVTTNANFRAIDSTKEHDTSNIDGLPIQTQTTSSNDTTEGLRRTKSLQPAHSSISSVHSHFSDDETPSEAQRTAHFIHDNAQELSKLSNTSSEATSSQHHQRKENLLEQRLAEEHMLSFSSSGISSEADEQKMTMDMNDPDVVDDTVHRYQHKIDQSRRNGSSFSADQYSLPLSDSFSSVDTSFNDIHRGGGNDNFVNRLIPMFQPPQVLRRQRPEDEEQKAFQYEVQLVEPTLRKMDMSNVDTRDPSSDLHGTSTHHPKSRVFDSQRENLPSQESTSLNTATDGANITVSGTQKHESLSFGSSQNLDQVYDRDTGFYDRVRLEDSHTARDMKQQIVQSQSNLAESISDDMGYLSSDDRKILSGWKGMAIERSDRAVNLEARNASFSSDTGSGISSLGFSVQLHLAAGTTRRKREDVDTETDLHNVAPKSPMVRSPRESDRRDSQAVNKQHVHTLSAEVASDDENSIQSDLSRPSVSSDSNQSLDARFHYLVNMTAAAGKSLPLHLRLPAMIYGNRDMSIPPPPINWSLLSSSSSDHTSTNEQSQEDIASRSRKYDTRKYSPSNQPQTTRRRRTSVISEDTKDDIEDTSSRGGYESDSSSNGESSIEIDRHDFLDSENFKHRIDSLPPPPFATVDMSRPPAPMRHFRKLTDELSFGGGDEHPLNQQQSVDFDEERKSSNHSLSGDSRETDHNTKDQTHYQRKKAERMFVPLDDSDPINNSGNEESKSNEIEPLAEAFRKRHPRFHERVAENQVASRQKREEINTQMQQQQEAAEKTIRTQNQRPTSQNLKKAESGIKPSTNDTAPLNEQQQSLLNRLATGERVKISAREMKERSRRNYQRLPEVIERKRQEEVLRRRRQRLDELRQQEKERRLIQRQRKEQQKATAAALRDGTFSR